MKKHIILAALIALSCTVTAACGSKEEASTSDTTVIRTDDMENMDITGRVITGNDGMLIISGEPGKQTAYVIVKDNTGNVLKDLKDGDEININADVAVNFIPKNVTILSGSASHSDEKVKLDGSLYRSLNAMYMVKDELKDSDLVEIVE